MIRFWRSRPRDGKRYGILWFAIVASLLCATTIRPNPLAPEMVTAGDRIWNDLLRLELSGALPVGLTSARPASRGEIAQWVADAADHPDADRASLARLQRAFARELRRIGRPGPYTETRSFLHRRGQTSPEDQFLDGVNSELRAGPTLGLQVHGRDTDLEFGDSTRAGLYAVVLFGRTVSLQGELFVGEIEGGRGIGDALIKDTDILYFAEEIGAAVAVAPFRIRLARGRHQWGVGLGPTLLLDNAAAPLSVLEYDLALPSGIRFRSWVGSLGAVERRGIAAHRLELPLHRNLRIAIAEGVRFEGGIDHPLYLLGLLPYTLVQRFDEQDLVADSLRIRLRNNVLASAELIYRPRPGLLTYTEILVDDIPAETADTPARIGARLGFALSPKVAGAPLELRIEGTKIGRYTYAVAYEGGCECDWIHQDAPLADRSGPDQEAIRLWIGRSLGRDHHLELRAIYANHGGGRLGEAWIGQEEDRSGLTRRALTVSGPVARERGVVIGYEWIPRDNLIVELDAGGSTVRNGEERSGHRWSRRFLFDARLSWRF